MEGCVFHIQRFSTDDGRGIRTTVFLKGCPLRCVWCHNAEGLCFDAEIAFYKESCIGCGACTATCKSGAIALKGNAVIDREACISCGHCADACPTGALCLIGKKMQVDAVMAAVRRDRIFYKKSGGLTISGGEPMAQAGFTIALAKAAKAEGISVAVETSGFGKKEDFAALLPFCDAFLFDCKASGTAHARLTGVDDGLILENLDFLCRNGASITLRCPIVEGANLTESFIEKIISLARKYVAIGSVQLMPYHKTGIGKSVSLGRTAQAVFATPSEEVLRSVAERVERESGKRTFYV